MKAIFKYPGSKWSIAEWVISFFPEHHSYLEAFGGSSAVLWTLLIFIREISSGIPNNIADMERRTIGTAKKGIVDIQVT